MDCENCIKNDVCISYLEDHEEGEANYCSFYEEKRPQGKWIEEKWGYLTSYRCSNCGMDGSDLWYFCHNCGSDNRKRGDNNEVL